MRYSGHRSGFALATLTFCLLSSGAAAAVDSIPSGNGATAADSLEWVSYAPPNGEEETYLRYLQISGAVRRYPWSLRGFSPGETRKLVAIVGTHPWSRSTATTSRDQSLRMLPLVAGLRANSSFPYGSNDGPTWAGRGITADATVGLALTAGPISLVLAPTAFVSQNAAFDLIDNGQSGDLRFGDGQQPTVVDRPQRFGDDPYQGVDPGNSTLRITAGPGTGGFSTGNMVWGPMELYPFLLGTNAAGFFHAFVGTAHPVNIWIGSIHGRLIWGSLQQSAYSPVQGNATYTSPADPGTRRFASGLLIVVEPRGVRGLELGVARFFHSPWPRTGIPTSYIWKPFENILKNRLQSAPGYADAGGGADNQLISAFMRWAFPAAGFEVYTEYSREDHSWDKRDFVQEPDHSRSYGLGFRKTLRLRPERMDGLTVELINFQLPHLARTGRGEGSMYIHSVMRQGHTQRGQLLGADVGVGASAGSTIRWDGYYTRGGMSVALHRLVRADRSSFFVGNERDPKSSDVQYSLDAEWLRRLRRIDVTTGLALIHNLNRDFRRDATSISAVLRARVPLGN